MNAAKLMLSTLGGGLLLGASYGVICHPQMKPPPDQPWRSHFARNDTSTGNTNSIYDAGPQDLSPPGSWFDFDQQSGRQYDGLSHAYFLKPDPAPADRIDTDYPASDADTGYSADQPDPDDSSGYAAPGPAGADASSDDGGPLVVTIRDGVAVRSHPGSRGDRPMATKLDAQAQPADSESDPSSDAAAGLDRLARAAAAAGRVARDVRMAERQFSDSDASSDDY
jgi:hypothetical protein